MRAVILVMVLAALVAAKRTSVSQGLASSRTLSTTCSGANRQTCKSCSTVAICGYDKTILAEYRCSDQDPKKKYCVNDGECSEVNDKNCDLFDDRCPLQAAGYYPDPQNCTRYLYCNKNAVGFEENCLVANNVYDQSTASCFLKKKSSDCFQVDCSSSKNKGKWFIYTPFPQIYFLCSSDGRAVTFKCLTENEVFDVNLKKCMFQCTTTGRFAVPEDENSYYECLNSSPSKLELFVKKCPLDLVFSDKTKRCEEGKNE